MWGHLPLHLAFNGDCPWASGNQPWWQKNSLSAKLPARAWEYCFLLWLTRMASALTSRWLICVPPPPCAPQPPRDPSAPSQSPSRHAAGPHEQRLPRAAPPASLPRLILCVFSLLPPPPHVWSYNRSLTHAVPKEYHKARSLEGAFLEQPEFPQQPHRSKRLFSIPEVAEEDAEHGEPLLRQGMGSSRARALLAMERGPARSCWGHPVLQGSWLPAEHRGPGIYMEDLFLEDRGCRFSRSATRSPDSGLDCGSEEEESRFSFRSTSAKCSPGPGHCPCRRSPRPLLARRRTLTRQSSIEEDFGEQVDPSDVIRSDDTQPSPERPVPRRDGWDEASDHEDFRGVWRKSPAMPDSRAAERLTQPPPRVADGPLVCQVTILPARLPNQSVLILLLVLPLVPVLACIRGTLWAALFGSFPCIFFFF